MSLYTFELKKLLFTRRGLPVILAGLIAVGILFALFPEQRDPRISASHKQYDLYLERWHGEDSTEKNAAILQEYQDIQAVLSRYTEMLKAHTEGTISEEEWQAYGEAYREAELHENSAGIFMEKALSFQQQAESEKRPQYIDEYGWNTAFLLLKIPNVFLLAVMVFLSAACVTSEKESGMLPLFLSAKEGRTKLFAAKFAALLTLCTAVSVLGLCLEGGILYLRGFLNDSEAPLGSILFFTDAWQPAISLKHALLLSLSLRFIALLLIAGMTYSIAYFLPNYPAVIVSAVLAFLFPLLLFLISERGTLMYFIGSLLSGSGCLIAAGAGAYGMSIPIMVHLGLFAVLLVGTERLYTLGFVNY